MKGTFIILAAIIFFFLGIIWTKKNSFNTIFKVILIIMAFYGAIVALEHYGYIIKQLK